MDAHANFYLLKDCRTCGNLPMNVNVNSNARMILRHAWGRGSGIAECWDYI